MENNLVEEVESNEIKILEVIYLSLWRYKFLNIFIILFCALLSVFYSLSLPNVYRSTSILISSENNSSGGLGAMLGQLGGLASIAGVNIGGDSKNKLQLVEVIRSRDFILSFIEKHDLKKDLFATKEWVRDKNLIVYDEALYDIKTSRWVREVAPPKSKIPSDDESYEKFRNVFRVSLDKKRGLYKLSMDSYSPYLAKEWLQLYVNEFNLFMKQKDINASTDNIEFLQNYLEKLPYNEIRTALFNLIEEQLKVLMLTKSKNNYSLEVIQTAFVPDNKNSPKRALICFAAVFVACFISLFLSMFLYVRRAKY